MNLKRIATGLIAGAVICSSTGVYPYAAMNYAAAAETADKAEIEEKEEAMTAESFLAGGYDAKNATIYSDGSKTFNMNGRTYNQGVVFAGRYESSESTASINYNTKDVSSLSWVWGHVDNTSMKGATVSIYLDDVLTDKYVLSENMLQQKNSLDVSAASVLKISVTFAGKAKFAMADVAVDDMKPVTSPVVPTYNSVDAFIQGRYNSTYNSSFSTVSDLDAQRINGRYYYQGIIFSGRYNSSASSATASFNTENIDKLSFSMGHIDNTQMTNATVSVYHDDVLVDKFALSATMEISDYSIDVSKTAELRFIIDFDGKASFAMTDITIDTNTAPKTGKSPTYGTSEMFISDAYNVQNMSSFTAVSDLESVKINGRNYYQGLLFSGVYSSSKSTSIVDFNVENVDTIKGTFGHVDNTAMTNAVLSVYKDNVLSEKIELDCNMLFSDVVFDVADCKNLRLSVTHNGKDKFALAEIGIDEIKAKKSFVTPDYKDGKAFAASAFDIYNANTFDFVSELEAYKVNNESCYNGIVFNGQYSSSTSTSSFVINTESINSISWVWGHVDETALSDSTAKIYLDNVLAEEIILTSGMVPTKQSIDVSGVSKIRVVVTNKGKAKYVIKDIEVSDEIVEVKIPLGDVDSDGSVSSVDASLVLAEYAAISTNGTLTFDDKAKKAADVNKDDKIDSSDASSILAFYAYTSTGGIETDMEKWLETQAE